MFRSVLAFGLACFMFTSQADAAPASTSTIPVLPGAFAGTDLQEVGYHRHRGHHRHHYRHRHHAPRYRHHAPRYRHHAPRVHHGYSQAHYNWCAAKYRSYNRHNNTWRAYSGAVHQCRSPY